MFRGECMRAAEACEFTTWAYAFCVLTGRSNIAFALVGQAAKYTQDNVYPLAEARGRSCIMLI